MLNENESINLHNFHDHDVVDVHIVLVVAVVVVIHDIGRAICCGDQRSMVLQGSIRSEHSF